MLVIFNQLDLKSGPRTKKIGCKKEKKNPTCRSTKRRDQRVQTENKQKVETEQQNK